MKTKELRTDYWKELKKEGKPMPLHYDEAIDTLFVYFSPEEKERIITHFVDENVAFLYRYSDKQIVGMRIEYFKEDFLPKAAENKGWTLSSTGEELDGISDLRFMIEIKVVKTSVKQYTIPKPIEKNIHFEPVFA
jgi:hypothetical protein